MTFKIRNSIVLGAIFLLITAGGSFYWLYYQPKQLKALNKEIEKIDTELVNLPTVMKEVEKFSVEFQDLKRRYDSRSKEIPPYDITSQTYAYMSRGIDEAGFLKFNLSYEGTRDFKNYSYNVYKLDAGEAEFANMYKFIYYLENGRRLYKINAMTLDQREAIDQKTKDVKKWVAFTMDLHAYFSTIQELSTSLAAKTLALAQAPFDPFNPLVLQQVSTVAPEGEIDVNKVEVKGVLPGKAFVLVDKGGSEKVVTVLHLGDRVWQGYVSRIVPAESKVEFTIDEGGVVRKIEQTIQFKMK